MSHLLKTGSSILKVGENLFRVRDTASYMKIATKSINTPRGVIFDPIVTNNRFFVIEQATNKCYVYDNTSFNLITTITGLLIPVVVVFDPIVANNRFAIGNLSGSETTNIYDATSYSLLHTITTVHGGSGVAFDPVASNNRMLVATDSSGLTEVDTTTWAAGRTLTGISSVRGIVFDPVVSNNRFFVSYFNTTVSANRIGVYDATTLVKTADIAVAANEFCFDPILSNNRLLVATGGSTVTSLNATTFGTIEVLSGFSTASGIAPDPNSGNNRIIVCENGTSSFSVFNKILS